ncbi:MAG: biotin transporter BioY [SAR202 cluster bacterium]|nr:biotin transporter BioY [SAR202 cluster bacterium]
MAATTQRTTIVDAVVPGQGLLRDLALVGAFTVLVAVLAQIAVRLPFTTVPITGQTLAVLLTGGALGARRGAVTLGLYLLLGTVGVPVFSPAGSALGGQTLHVILPWKGLGAPVWLITSGGYIVGFVAAAFLVGRLAERGWERGWRVTLAMLAGSIAIYVPGLLWLGYCIGTGALNSRLGFDLAAVIPGSSTLDKTLVGGLYPFIVGDLIKLYIASIALPGAWALIGRRRG